MLLREWKASKIHPLCHVTLQNMCALYSINHLCSYFVPHPREVTEHSPDLAGRAAPSPVMLSQWDW